MFDAVLGQCIWENRGELPGVESVFRQAIVLIVNFPKIGTHMSGSAVETSVFRGDAGSKVWRVGSWKLRSRIVL